MLVVANWKAYVEDAEKARALLAVSKRLARSTGVAIVLAPPAPLLGLLARGAAGIELAAQDVSATTGGAHTGEVTAAAYRAGGATHAIIGHSERRASGDDGVVVAEKLQHAIAQELTPLLCIGESSRDEGGRYLVTVREQLTSALMGLSPKERGAVIVSYEPVWAIGKTAAAAIEPSDLHETALYIRKVLAELLPGRSAGHSRILYGGSVEPGNARALAGATDIDGFLVGHASVDVDSFSALVRAIA